MLDPNMLDQKVWLAMKVLFSVVEVHALWRTLDYLHMSLQTSLCPQGAFMLEQKMCIMNVRLI